MTMNEEPEDVTTETEVTDAAETAVEEVSNTNAANPDDGRRLYEAMWVCDASRGKENTAKVVDELTELIERAGGAVVNCAKWDERRLAYPIRDNNHKKHRRGLYCLSHFRAEGDVIARLERLAKLSDTVLRVLILVDEDGIDITPPRDDDGRGRTGRGGRRDRRRDNRSRDEEQPDSFE